MFNTPHPKQPEGVAERINIRFWRIRHYSKHEDRIKYLFLVSIYAHKQSRTHNIKFPSAMFERKSAVAV